MKRLLLFGFLFMSSLGFSQVIIYMNRVGNTYTIPCKIDGLELNFIFDTGSDEVSISLTEAIFMYKNGILKRDEIFGTSYARLANGEITKNTEILIRDIEIGGIKLYNIKASVVHELAAPLLLGQSAIQKLGTIQLDGNKLIILQPQTLVNQPATYDPGNENSYPGVIHEAIDPVQFNGYIQYFPAIETEVNKCAPIYDRPDLQNCIQIGSVRNGVVYILGKVNNNYYFVEYNSTRGYIFKESLIYAKP